MGKINPRLSILQKDGVYAIYLDFDFLFLWNEAAEWFSNIITAEKIDDIKDIPNDFIEFLIGKQIIIEEEVETGVLF